MFDHTTMSSQRLRLLMCNDLVGKIHEEWPERPEPNPHVPTRTAVMALLEQGVSPMELLDAAVNYRIHCEKEGTKPKFTLGSTRFYRDGIWKQYAYEVRVFGLTREEWRQSGQDMSKFFDHIKRRQPKTTEPTDAA